MPGETKAFLAETAYAKAWSSLRLNKTEVQRAVGGQKGGNGEISHSGNRFIILERDFSVTK